MRQQALLGPIGEAVPAAAEPIAPSGGAKIDAHGRRHLTCYRLWRVPGGSPGTGAAAAPSGKFAQQAANSGGLLTWPPQFDRWQALPRSRDRTPRDCTYALA